jgi:D-glycero-beta-D-manno-heptose 1-phosphate adenylyltransferase
MLNKQIIEGKIFTLGDLKKQINVWRLQEQKIVFTNGCFDLLHLGHIDYLMKAADLGDKLIIGLNTDLSVKGLNKGSSRPIQDEHSRAMILAALHFTAAVVFFDTPTPYELIKAIAPDFLVKGADYQPEEIVGYDIVKGRGGEVITLEFLPGFSTSLIEQKIKRV